MREKERYMITLYRNGRCRYTLLCNKCIIIMSEVEM